MFCWHCKKKVDISGKVGFHAVCPYCDYDLHVCNNCRHFLLGKPNNCNVPLTEPVIDREKANFCEDFSPLKMLPSDEKKQDINDVSEKLFQEKSDLKTTDFNDLF